MALIESALLAVKRSSFSSSIHISKSLSLSSSSFNVNNVRSIESISIHSKRRLSTCCQDVKVGDIEDLGNSVNTQKKIRKLDSLLHRFRRKRALSVTDMVQSEWCQKQMEFILLRGKPKATEAMKAGTERHAKLEAEVVQKIKIHVKEIEDSWALKLMNFIVGANQLLFEGLTRELPVIGYLEGVWMVGVIDEIRLPINESVQSPFLVENKTRSRDTLPAEAQKRNSKLQLMCYKYMWDNIVTSNFPASRFYTFYGLNSHYILSQEVQDLAAASGFPANTLDDIVMYYRNTCAVLPPSHNELLIRYEFQRDHSLLGEEKFTYDPAWLMSQLRCSLEFWLGEQEASYVSPDERWKCRFCNFATICPNNSTESETKQAETELDTVSKTEIRRPS
ncbi:hypothetical protein AQUCO_02700099v1 [Aquilegia coerulea]|uniref:Exonuclease V, chloroplastic n=1 Tax=Aquilegia coerulea TaxID=218851 RepID=A0A2G5D547_AQUCA|nr:hypothetical protein AQUCO_02700099v1 [Aquilegia coerulea]